GIEVVKSVARYVTFRLPVVDPDPLRQKKEIKQGGAQSYAIGSAAVIRHRPRCIDLGGHNADIHRPFEVFLIPVFGPYIQYRGEASPVGGGPVAFVEIHMTDQAGIEQGNKPGRVIDIEQRGSVQEDEILILFAAPDEQMGIAFPASGHTW